MNILIINGPNLNLLGKRETSIYGNLSFEDFFEKLKQKYPDHNFSYFQSNVEGELINRLHLAREKEDAVIINAGAYTHTSIAIADAIKAIEKPVIEVHISNILTREDYRHKSIIGPVCIGSIMGFGLESYRLAVEYFTDKTF